MAEVMGALRDGGIGVMGGGRLEGHATGGGRQQTGQHAQQRRLAGAVAADHVQRLAAVEHEAEAGEDGPPAPLGREVVDREGQGGARRLTASRENG